MNRTVTALGLAIVLVGCTTGTESSPGVLSPDPRLLTPQPTVRGTLPVDPSRRTGVVAYEFDNRIWVVNVDGSNAHELLPDMSGSQYPIAWSGDGSRLLFSGGSEGGFLLTDASGSAPEMYELLCPDAAGHDALLHSCQPDTGSVAISHDGTRLAYAILEGTHDQTDHTVTSALVAMDLATTRVTRLSLTATTYPVGDCETVAHQGENGAPSWSPDGTRLAFERDSIGPSANGVCQKAILTVNVDDTDLQQVVPPDSSNADLHSSWSPEGSLILLAGGGTWTRTGRIASLRFTDTANGRRGDLWITDADGRNEMKLEATVPALTAAGCITCPYPIYGPEPVVDPLVVRQTPPYEQFWITRLLWQPIPEDQP